MREAESIKVCEAVMGGAARIEGGPCMRKRGGRSKNEGTKPAARLAQSAERKALNLVVVGSSPTVGVVAS